MSGNIENWDSNGEDSWVNPIIGSSVRVQDDPHSDGYIVVHDLPGNPDNMLSNGAISSKVDARQEARDWMKQNPYSGLSSRSDSWFIDALETMKDKLGNRIGLEDIENGKPRRFIAENLNSGQKYYVYKSEEAVTVEAQKHAMRELRERPETFNDSFLQDHVYITETDKRMMAQEEARRHFEGLDDQEIMEEAEAHGIDADDPDRAREELEMKKAEELKEELSDPYQWYAGYMGMSEEQVLELDPVRIDVEEASKDAVKADGAMHFLHDHSELVVSERGGIRAYSIR